MPLATCPNQHSLRDFRLGKLPLELAGEIAEHLDVCPSCQASMETISDSHDTLVHSLRQQPDTEFDAEPELQKALAAVERLDTRPHGQTASRESPMPLADEMPGALRDYQLLEKLGAGGMGTVYKARHQRLKRTVALKVLPPDRTRDKRAVARFEREMEAVGKLEHPNIVRALDAGEERGMHYLVMEFVDGIDLSQLVKRHGPLAVADACELVRQAAAGLQSAHEHGLVHRDVKPSNLMLTAAGQVKVLDLGLALLLAEQPGGDELTGTSQMMGTADYCAPEQVGDSHTVDIRADIYSLGCTLFKLLTGHAPFSGEQYDTAMKKLMAHVTRPVRPIRELKPDVPEGLANVLARMLAKQPAERYSSPAEVITALAPFALQSDLGKLFAETSRPSAPAAAGPAMSETTPHLSSALTGTRTHHEAAPVGAYQPEAQARPITSPSRSGPSTPGWRGLPPRWRVGLVCAAAAAALLAGVLIVIKDREGKVVATVETKDRADVTLDPEYTAEIKPSDGAAPMESDRRPHAPRGENHAERGSYAGRDEVATAIPKTQDLSPKTSPNPKSKIENPKSADAPPAAIAPFDEDQARQHQQAWADHLGVPLEHTNSIGMKFILIPPGEFTMGSTPEEIEETLKQVNPNDKHWQERVKSEAPQHKVVLTRPIYLAIHEVTQKEYEAVMGQNPSYFARTNPDEKVVKQLAELDTANHPVEQVSWNDAAEFCARLSKQEELKPFYFRAGETVTALKGTGYRLPTEAEWEFACRAGTTTKFWNSDATPAGWFDGNSGGRTHEVEEVPANPFGLFDVHGNVWEWIEDSWEPTFYERLSDKPAVNPNCLFSAGAQRVIRGGNWNFYASYCRSASRYALDPASRVDSFGFRVVLVAVSPRASR
jgi:serine/threonine protein kinase